MPQRKRKTIGATEAQEGALCPIERDIVDLKKERVVAVDENCNVVLDKRGGKNKVKLTADEVAKLRDTVITHNHPTTPCADRASAWRVPSPGKFEIGGTISPADFQTAMHGNAREIRAITRTVVNNNEQATVLFSLQRPPKGWSVPRFLAMPALRRAVRDALSQVKVDVQYGGLSPCDIMADPMHLAWHEVGEHFGMKYTARVLKKG